MKPKEVIGALHVSTVLLGQVWPLQMGSAQKSVLISLADQANDEGLCWPSIRSICTRTCLKERAVQKAISWLENAKAIFRQFRGGHSTHYIVTPARYAPPARNAPRPTCTIVPHVVHPTPAPDAPPGVHVVHPESSVEPSENRKRTTKAKLLPSDFLLFWEAYPRKVGRGMAAKAWERMKEPPCIADMLAAIKIQNESSQWRRDGGQFIPHPTTWLNQERWADVPMNQEQPDLTDNGRQAVSAAERWMGETANAGK